MDLELADKVRALADKYEAMFGPFPNGFQRDLPIKQVVRDLRRLVGDE